MGTHLVFRVAEHPRYAAMLLMDKKNDRDQLVYPKRRAAFADSME